MRCLVSGGGTGGHVYPALAVARALRDARSDVELDYVGGVRGFERRIVADHPMRGELRYHELVVRSLRSAGLSLHTVGDPARLATSVPQAWWLLGRLRPAALFTTGGYLALPLVLAAGARRIPTLVWEGNVLPGRATRAIGRYATRVAVSFPPTLEAFPSNGFVAGTPIRSFAGIDRDAARRSFGLGPDDRLLLVFGGLAGRDPPEHRRRSMRCRGCSPTGTSCTSPATRAWPMRAPPASISRTSSANATSRSRS